MNLQNYQFFLLDFDGLLVDTESLHYLAYKRLCQSKGCELDWSFSTYCEYAHGEKKPLKEAIYLACPKLFKKYPKWDELYEEKKEILLKLLQKEPVALMPGAQFFLNWLHKNNLPRCVVTNSSKTSIDILRSKLPILQTISYWITREDYQKPKPSSESYVLAIDKFTKPTDAILGFEDTLKGLKALMQTKATSVLVCDTKHPQLKDPMVKGVLHISSLEELFSSNLS